MRDFAHAGVAEIVCEWGGASRLGELCARRGVSNALIVTDRVIAGLGLLDDATAGLRSAGISFAIYDGVVADPPADVAEGASAAARDAEADGVVGVGGGSSMDVAKLAALLARTDQSLEEIYGIGNATGGRLPLIQVPTTAGTGSEATPIAIVTVDGGRKQGVVAPQLFADIALLDAELTVCLPRDVTATTGIDAMAHAIEAHATRTKRDPFSDMLAGEALALLGGSIERAASQPNDREARQDMLLGAHFAGRAFANAPVGGAHALAYPIGGRYHVPHGLSVSLVLPHVLRFNADVAASEYARLSAALGETPGREKGAAGLISGIERLVRRLDLPATLSAVGVPEEDLPLLAADAMEQTRLLVNNPREIGPDDALAIYRAAHV